MERQELDPLPLLQQRHVQRRLDEQQRWHLREKEKDGKEFQENFHYVYQDFSEEWYLIEKAQLHGQPRRLHARPWK